MNNVNEKKVVTAKDVFFLEEYPYSQAIKAGAFLFISGILPTDKNGKSVGKGDAVTQTIQIFENMKKILNEADLEMKDVAKINMYFKNINDLPKILEVRKKYFSKPYPCATGVEISGLLKEEWLVEIEAVASY